MRSGPGGPGGRGPGGPGGSGGSRGPGGPGGPGGGGGGLGGRRGKRSDDPEKTGWRRYIPNWKIVVAVCTVLLLAFVTLVAVAYHNTPVPTKAQQDALRQESVITYADGKPLARIGMHREEVKLKEIPPFVQKAVLAAEDRDFEENSGISTKGIARALFKTVTGGDVQGGSTITQQMARNYYQGLSQDRTISRKFKEILISIRLGNEVDKNVILELYLNTIYFGRSSYGIQAASRAYFHKTVDKLNVSEAAMLAAMIQRPTYFVTQGSDDNPPKKALIERWNYVLDGMVEEGWLDSGQRAAAKFPATQKTWSDVKDNSQTGYLKDRVMKELKSLGITEQMIETGGLQIKTTFQKDLQDYTAYAVKQMRQKYNLSKDIHFGLSMVDPKTGGVVAAYGGPGYSKQQFDDSFDARVQPGSSFKPIVLATALEQGISLRTPMDGSYKRTIGGATFTNDSRSENGVYNLKQMTAMSINTAYVELGQKVGLKNVIEMSKKMGIPEGTSGLKQVTSLPLGVIDTSPTTMASVYSAFAAEGKHRDAHVIAKVTRKDGSPVINERGTPLKKLPWETPTEVFSEGVARDATSAMRAVVTSGTGTRASLGARPVAGKTGTTEENKAAWFVGYTPEFSTSVAMWREDKNRNRLSLVGIGGYNQIYGGTVPADLFKTFMTYAHDGKPISQFGPPGNVGQVAPWAAPTPTPEPSETPTATPSPSCEPGNGNGNGPGNGNQQRPGCLTTSPTPSITPTPSLPSNQPCNQLGMPAGCNPNIPPSDPPPKWWCRTHPAYPACRTTPEEPNEPQTNTGQLY